MFGFYICMLWYFLLKYIMYILLIVFRFIFKLFLKFRVLKDLNIFLKIYLIEVCIWFMDKLKVFIFGVNFVFLNGVCKWIFKGYVGFLYKYMF